MMRVLLTLPHEEDRSELLDRLVADGFDVVTARTGREAMERMRSGPPDVAVLDHRLETRTGAAVAGWARDHVTLHRAPVILLVEAGDLDTPEVFADCGAVDFLVKPVRYPELRVRLELRADTGQRLAGMFADAGLHRMAIQENVDAFLRQHREREEEILGLLFTDPGTGLFNRAYFKIKSSEELKRAQRYDLPLSALLIELSRPGAARDGNGAFPASAMTRKEIAGILLVESRDLDVIGRFSPSEFALLLPSTAQEGAVQLAQRMSERILAHDFTDAADAQDLQVRVGIATYPLAGVRTPRDLMSRAHEALEKARSHGKRDVCIWEAARV